MRKMVIVRGPQAAGKTHLVRSLGLEGHRLSADMMREAHRGHVMNLKGEMVIDQEDAHQIWELVRQSLQRRLSRGEFVILDATFATLSTYEGMIKLAHEHRYAIAIVDLYGTDIDLMRNRNAQRPDHERVPEKSVERMINAYQPHDVDDPRIDIIIGRENAKADLQKWIAHEVHDLTNWDKIIHIGDLQGVFEAMFAEGSPMTRELRDDTFYIFVGDALDRGMENGEVLDWIIDQVVPRYGKNVVWIEGNHERHLFDYINDGDIVSREFEERTLPQLCKTNPKGPAIRAFLDGMIEYFIYHHHGEHVVVTHAGVPAVPFCFNLVPGHQAMHGAGGFGADVDEAFNDWAIPQLKDWKQVHGHRNRLMHPTWATKRSFNLEGQAEFGGHIRIAVRSKYGWQTYDLRNDNYRSPREWQEINKEEGRRAFSAQMPIPAWIARGEEIGYLAETTLEQFQSHDHVNIRTQEDRSHIDTIAFAKTAFYGQHWDGVTNKARGLFIDNRDRRIVARSYPKFFNLGEREDNDIDSVATDWQYPMTISLKENGFLGLVSWDHHRNEIIFSSKGSMDGDFAVLFHHIAQRLLGHGGIEKLGRAVRDLRGTAVFEVVSPDQDPHIAEYNGETLVMLDFIHNHEQFEKLDHDDLVKLGKYVGVPVREIIGKMPNEHALRAIVSKLQDPNSGINRRLIEGVVIEDAAGRFVKVKSEWYARWKRARGLVERMALQRRRGEDVSLDVPPELEDFIAWVEKQDDSITDLPIIELRRRFEETPDNVLIVDREALEKEKREASLKRQNDKRIKGFMIGYDALLEQVRNGTASIESVKRLMERGYEVDYLKGAMMEREDFAEIKRYIEKHLKTLLF